MVRDIEKLSLTIVLDSSRCHKRTREVVKRGPFCEETTREKWGRDRNCEAYRPAQRKRCSRIGRASYSGPQQRERRACDYTSHLPYRCGIWDIRAGRGWRRRVIVLGKPKPGDLISLVAVPIVASPSRYRHRHRRSHRRPSIVAVMIGVARVALADCLGGGSGILMGVVVGIVGDTMQNASERRRQETLRRGERPTCQWIPDHTTTTRDAFWTRKGGTA